MAQLDAVIEGKTHAALAEVRSRVGGEYKLCVTSLYKRWSFGHTQVNAVVTVYNDHEIKDVPVSWEE